MLCRMIKDYFIQMLFKLLKSRRFFAIKKWLLFSGVACESSFRFSQVVLLLPLNFIVNLVFEFWTWITFDFGKHCLAINVFTFS